MPSWEISPTVKYYLGGSLFLPLAVSCSSMGGVGECSQGRGGLQVSPPTDQGPADGLLTAYHDPRLQTEGAAGGPSLRTITNPSSLSICEPSEDALRNLLEGGKFHFDCGEL